MVNYFFQVREFHDQGSRITFSIHSDHIWKIGISISESNAFKIGDFACDNKVKGELRYHLQMVQAYY